VKVYTVIRCSNTHTHNGVHPHTHSCEATAEAHSINVQAEARRFQSPPILFLRTHPFLELDDLTTRANRFLSCSDKRVDRGGKFSLGVKEGLISFMGSVCIKEAHRFQCPLFFPSFHASFSGQIFLKANKC